MKTLCALFLLLVVVPCFGADVTVNYGNGVTAAFLLDSATLDSGGNLTINTPAFSDGICTDPPLSFSPDALPDGFVNAYYAQDVCLVGATGEPPIILTGYLPPGITWQRHGNCYLLSGKPPYAGVYQFTVAALDISKTYTFLVVTYR